MSMMHTRTPITKIYVNSYAYKGEAHATHLPSRVAIQASRSGGGLHRVAVVRSDDVMLADQ